MLFSSDLEYLLIPLFSENSFVLIRRIFPHSIKFTSIHRQMLSHLTHFASFLSLLLCTRWVSKPGLNWQYYKLPAEGSIAILRFLLANSLNIRFFVAYWILLTQWHNTTTLLLLCALSLPLSPPPNTHTHKHTQTPHAILFLLGPWFIWQFNWGYTTNLLWTYYSRVKDRSRHLS